MHGKGNRFILANTEELHERIERLNTRARELEDALRVLQASVSREPHPLLLNTKGIAQPTKLSPLSSNVAHTYSEDSPQLPSSESAAEEAATAEDDALVDAFGTLAIGARGEARYFGQTARGEYLLHASSDDSDRLFETLGEPGIPVTEPPDQSRIEMLSMLPPLSEAICLCENYQQNGKYLYPPLSRGEVFDEILVEVYGTGSFDTPQAYDTLALLFIIFAIGVFYEPGREPYSREAQEYFYLARSALGFNTRTSRRSVESLLHMAQYLLCSDWDSKNANSAWLYIGHAVRLGHSIGLHLDGARWKLSEECTERRSRTFWQSFIFDTWSSFQFGRPPITNTTYIDCPFPPDTDETVDSDGQKHMGFHAWSLHFATLVHSVMDTAFGAKQPAYSLIGTLDRKLRDSPFPPSCRPILDTVEDLAACVPVELNIRRWLVLSRREIALLHLHRPYFAQALQEQPTDLAKHRYVPSVLAVYRSAWRLTQGLQVIWDRAPEWLSRHTVSWSLALSAAIVLCQLATRATSNMTPSAVAQLDVLLKTWENGSLRARAAAHMLEIIRDLHRKAHEAIDEVPPHDGSTGVTPSEIDRLGGKTHFLGELDSNLYSERMLFEYATRPRASAPQQPVGDIGIPLSDPNPASMHPAIAQDMRSFDMGSSTFDDFFVEVPPALPVSLPPPDFGPILHPVQDSQMNDTGLRAGGLKYPTPLSDQMWHSFADYVRF